MHSLVSVTNVSLSLIIRNWAIILGASLKYLIERELNATIE